MDQEPLFHEDLRDSLRHLVKALGGLEVVGAELWPAKTRKAAGNWLSDCLNPERPAKLDLEEVQTLLRMGRDNSVHVAMWFLCDESGYTRPSAIERLDQEAEVGRQIDRSLKELSRLTHRLERIRGAA